MNITILGCGAYSLAIALQLAKQKNNKITMWTENNDTLVIFNKTHRLSKVFDVKIPNNITLTTSYEEAVKNTELIFFITSAKYLRSVCENIKPFYKDEIPICIASKGIENKTCEMMSTIVKKTLKTKNISLISGPTFAIDLINNEPCGLAIAGLNKNAVNIVQKTLANDTLKLRKSSDIIGIQICGSIKNIIAIAAGILKGLGYSESTQAFLINESLHDIKNIIYYLGGKKKTILSFAGIGDLLLTCTSSKSRNFSFGYTIGSTNNKNSINSYLENNTVEGYYTLISVHELLNKKGISIELIDLMYDIIINNHDPKELAKFLIKKL